MSKIWFTADLHLGHKNIIGLCGRPFKSAGHMDFILMKNLRDCLNSGDKLYFLGDLAWRKIKVKEFLDAFPDIKIIAIFGNHDNSHVRKILEKRCEKAVEALNIKYKGTRMALSHYPMRSWKLKPKRAWHLHGHCHGNCREYEYQYDVGVDCNNFYPVSFEELREKFRVNQFGMVIQVQEKDIRELTPKKLLKLFIKTFVNRSYPLLDMLKEEMLRRMQIAWDCGYV